MPSARQSRGSNSWKTYLLAIDLDEAMYAELPCLSDTARKQRSEDGRVQPPLNRPVCHLHVRRQRRYASPVVYIRPSSSSGSLLRAIVIGEIVEVHGHHGGQVSSKQPLPLLLPYLLAMVCSRACFRLPFLLEVCSRRRVWPACLRKTVQRPS
jgi:hypothetical protein